MSAIENCVRDFKRDVANATEDQLAKKCVRDFKRDTSRAAKDLLLCILREMCAQLGLRKAIQPSNLIDTMKTWKRVFEGTLDGLRTDFGLDVRGTLSSTKYGEYTCAKKHPINKRNPCMYLKPGTQLSRIDDDCDDVLGSMQCMRLGLQDAATAIRKDLHAKTDTGPTAREIASHLYNLIKILGTRVQAVLESERETTTQPKKKHRSAQRRVAPSEITVEVNTDEEELRRLGATTVVEVDTNGQKVGDLIKNGLSPTVVVNLIEMQPIKDRTSQWYHVIKKLGSKDLLPTPENATLSDFMTMNRAEKIIKIVARKFFGRRYLDILKEKMKWNLSNREEEKDTRNKKQGARKKKTRGLVTFDVETGEFCYRTRAMDRTWDKLKGKMAYGRTPLRFGRIELFCRAVGYRLVTCLWFMVHPKIGEGHDILSKSIVDITYDEIQTEKTSKPTEADRKKSQQVPKRKTTHVREIPVEANREIIEDVIRQDAVIVDVETNNEKVGDLLHRGISPAEVVKLFIMQPVKNRTSQWNSLMTKVDSKELLAPMTQSLEEFMTLDRAKKLVKYVAREFFGAPYLDILKKKLKWVLSDFEKGIGLTRYYHANGVFCYHARAMDRMWGEAQGRITFGRSLLRSGKSELFCRAVGYRLVSCLLSMAYGNDKGRIKRDHDALAKTLVDIESAEIRVGDPLPDTARRQETEHQTTEIEQLIPVEVSPGAARVLEENRNATVNVDVDEEVVDAVEMMEIESDTEEVTQNDIAQHPLDLYNRHLDNLDPNKMIHDTVLNVWIELVIGPICSDPEKKYISSVFSLNNTAVIQSRLHANISRDRLVSSDVVYLPLLTKKHFLLLVILRPCNIILYVDSLDGHRFSNLSENLLLAIQKVFMSDQRDTVVVNIKSPRQPTDESDGKNDCGIFMLMNLQYLVTTDTPSGIVTAMRTNGQDAAVAAANAINLRETPLRHRVGRREMIARRRLLRDCIQRLLKSGCFHNRFPPIPGEILSRCEISRRQPGSRNRITKNCYTTDKRTSSHPHIQQ